MVSKFETAHRQQITTSAASEVVATSSPDHTVRIFDPSTFGQVKLIKVDTIVMEMEWINEDALLVICQQECFIYNHKASAITKIEGKIATSAVCLSEELFLVSCRDNTLALFGYNAAHNKLVQLREQFADEHYFQMIQVGYSVAGIAVCGRIDFIDMSQFEQESKGYVYDGIY